MKNNAYSPKKAARTLAPKHIQKPRRVKRLNRFEQMMKSYDYRSRLNEFKYRLREH